MTIKWATEWKQCGMSAMNSSRVEDRGNSNNIVRGIVYDNKIENLGLPKVITGFCQTYLYPHVVQKTFKNTIILYIVIQNDKFLK